MQPRHEWKRHVARSLVLLAASRVLLGAAEPVAEPSFTDEDFQLPKLPMWVHSVGVRGAFGYKDNVTLSHTGAQASAFWQSGLEAVVFRLPTHGWQFNFYASAEDVRYFDAPSVDSEQVVMAMAQAAKDLGRGWKSTWGLNYLFQNQVFDLSATYTNRGSIGQVLGHTLSPRGNVRKQFGAFWAEAEAVGTRQLLDAPLDSFWLVGPRALLGYGYGRGSEVTLAYQWSHLAYDTREQVDTAGAAIPGTELALRMQGVELALSQVWDEKRRWQTTTRLGYEANLDNGSGFYDYDVFRFVQQLRFRTPTWEITAQVRVGYYDYATQTVIATDNSPRERTWITASLRAEKKLTSHWRLHAAYYFDRSRSDLDFDDYRANMVLGGVGYEF
jgi:hypothetical protein